VPASKYLDWNVSWLYIRTCFYRLNSDEVIAFRLQKSKISLFFEKATILILLLCTYQVFQISSRYSIHKNALKARLTRFFLLYLHNMKMKKQFTIGVLISAIFIFLAFREVNLTEMISALEKANYVWIFPGIAFMFLSLYIRSLRWRYFLLSIKKVKVSSLFSAMMIGYMANNVFPLRLGELLRAYAIGKSEDISKATSFATILVERIIDVVSLLLILGFTIFFHDFPDEIRNAALVIFMSAIGIIGLIVFLMGKATHAMRFVGFLLRPFPPRARERMFITMKSFLEGFQVFRHTHHYFAIIMQSIVLWVLYAGIIFVTLIAFNLQLEGASYFIASLVILVMISIGIMIPSSPGFIGTYHYLCMKGLALFGVGESDALSFAIVLHLSNYIPMTLVGFFYFWKENLHFKDALKEKNNLPVGDEEQREPTEMSHPIAIPPVKAKPPEPLPGE